MNPYPVSVYDTLETIYCLTPISTFEPIPSLNPISVYDTLGPTCCLTLISICEPIPSLSLWYTWTSRRPQLKMKIRMMKGDFLSSVGHGYPFWAGFQTLAKHISGLVWSISKQSSKYSSWMLQLWFDTSISEIRSLYDEKMYVLFRLVQFSSEDSF